MPLTSNLYPPVLPDSQPAALRTQNYKIYFALSQYNSLDNIKNVQITLRNQKTNRSALNTTKYPSEIKIVDKANIVQDTTVNGDYKYYVTIAVSATAANSDVVRNQLEQNNYLEIGQYYIVQMRFTSVTVLEDPPVSGGIDTWLYNNRDGFSEWSTICLIKGISQPLISINNLQEGFVTTLSAPLTKVLGRLYFTSQGVITTTPWERKTIKSNNGEKTSSTTRICSKNYIDISNYSYVTFNIINGYKYSIHFYDLNQNWLGSAYTISWQTENRKIATNNAYYMIIVMANVQDTEITTSSNTNLTVNFLAKGSNSSLETEYLKSYNINIYKTSDSSTSLYKTEQIYTNQYNPNEINHAIPYEFDRGVNHTLKFTYITNNGYEDTLTYGFKISAKNILVLDGVISVTPEEEKGRMKFDIDFDFEHVIKSEKNLIIKRASSRDNFKIWENIKTIPHSETVLRHVWYDTTIESGVWYKYRVEQEDENNLGRISEIYGPVICNFEDIFLTNKDRQLKIQFNPSIGDFKYNVMDSQQVTLGAKYPFVRRNGNSYFRSFSVGGLISAFMDDDNWYGIEWKDDKFHIKNERQTFSSIDEIYQESKDLYAQYNLDNNISSYEDYIYEREFRQKVSDFLYENSVKLFKSPTEGNILIRLQNVAFQPVNELGRRLYSFTATAIEMDELTTNNFNKYNITNKYHYNYNTKVINGYFDSKESLITRLLNTSGFTNYNRELLKIFKLDIQLNQATNAIFYIKTINDPEFIRYMTKQGYLLLDFNESEDSSIEDCYFYGIHLNDDQYTITDQYYYSTNEISNPVNGKVYYIYYDSTDVFLINNYISYSNRRRLLTTEEQQTLRTLDQDYVLLADGLYQKYIRYNNAWYPFSESGDVLMRTNAKVTYYYETKEMI